MYRSPVMDRVSVRLVKLLWSVQGRGKSRIRVWVGVAVRPYQLINSNPKG